MSFDELETLFALAARNADKALSGTSIHALHQCGLIELSIEGWVLTAMGRITASMCAYPTPTGPLAKDQTIANERRRASRTDMA